MEILHEYFEAALKKIGIESLPCDLSSQAVSCLRLQIGGEEKIYLGDHRKPNGAYIENAVNRAMEIFDAMPQPDLLRIDDCPELSLPGLPQPDFRFGDSCYWELGREIPFLRKLLREIIRAELDPAGYENLVSNVYFLSTWKKFLFCLYDDRRADLAAEDRETLRPIYEAFGKWIPEENRDPADRLFAD